MSVLAYLLIPIPLICYFHCAAEDLPGEDSPPPSAFVRTSIGAPRPLLLWFVCLCDIAVDFLPSYCCSDPLLRVTTTSRPPSLTLLPPYAYYISLIR